MEGTTVLADFGIKVVGKVDTVEELPDPLNYNGQYGDAYMVGTEKPYEYYIFTRAFAGEEEPTWFDLGIFPQPGPQGPKGDTGDKGDKGDTGDKGDKGATGATGAQGPQGATGAQGPQGIQGPQGPKGDTGDTLRIIGTLSNPQQLPSPTESIRANAYLIPYSDADTPSASNYLWAIVGDETLVWDAIGQFEGIQGPQGATGAQGPQGPQGIQGIQGPQGPQGIQGIPGQDSSVLELNSLDVIDDTMVNKLYTYNGSLYERRTYNIRIKNTATGSSTLQSDGTITSADSRYYVTDYLDVYPDYSTNHYEQLVTNGLTMYGAYYDSTKTFISSFSYSYSSRTSGNLSNIPANAKYVRFSYDVGGQNSSMQYNTVCFYNLTEKNVIFVRSNDLSLTTQDDTQVSQLAQTRKDGTLLTLDDVTATIIIGKGVASIKVTAITEFYQNSASTRFSNVIKLNGGNLEQGSGIERLDTANQNGYSVITNIAMVRVSTDDRITFVVKSINSNSSSPDVLQKQHTKFIVEVLR